MRIPYGISNFEQLVQGGYYYVDKTPYIEKLERLGEPFVVFLRPRRFGKSLFASALHYYYGQEHKERFQSNFGKYYLGQNPTPLAGSYLVLSLSFSAIDTDKQDTTYRDFLFNVKEAALNFTTAYPHIFTQEDKAEIAATTAPQNVLKMLFGKVGRHAPGQKVFVIIDEYDHFANELLAFHFDHFTKIVGKNGWVRKFYETLKEGAHAGVVERMFITGVSPITLDSLTSGFNISKNLTTDAELNEMAGFTESEVLTMLENLNVPTAELPSLREDLRQWYDGYLFSRKGKERVYNPDMILYFVNDFQKYRCYPDDLLDENIASDYSKIRNMFRIKDEEGNLDVLRQLLEEGAVAAPSIKRFSFEDEWTRDHFINLIFYLGILTVQGEALGKVVYTIPNAVIRRLYFQYFQKIILKKASLAYDRLRIEDKLEVLAQENQIQPLLDLTGDILSQLATQDRAHFSEQHIKAVFASLFHQVGYYNIFSELEVRKSPTDKGRVDFLLTRRPPHQPKCQFVFELKYLPKSKEADLETVKTAAIQQLRAYLDHDDRLRHIDGLHAYVIVFVAEKGEAVEVG